MVKNALFLFALICTTGAVNAQILVANDSASFAAWTTSDLDMDGFDWMSVDLTAGGTAMDAAEECMISHSYDNAGDSALIPDNLLMSPSVDCSGATNVFLTWTTGSPESTGSEWYEEYYSVYVVTDLVPLLGGSFPTPVFEDTLEAGASFLFEEVDVTTEAAGQGTVYVVIRHHNCTDENWMIMDDVVLSENSSASIEEGSLVAKVYPNPVQDVLNVHVSTEAISVSVIGMDGKVISTQNVNGSTTTIDVANLNPGVYLYEVITAQGVLRKPFVKK